MARSFDAGSNAACLTAHKKSWRGFGAPVCGFAGKSLKRDLIDADVLLLGISRVLVRHKFFYFAVFA